MIDLIHRIVAVPWIYDLTQFAAGQSLVEHKLKQLVKTLPAGQYVLDIGGGTGLYRSLWSDGSTYICCDLDTEKLLGFTHKFADPAVQCDGTQLPFKGASLDIVVCIAVAHHLDDTQFEHLLAEAARILKTGGTLVFLEPVYAEKRLPGRFLWSLDRGSNPRTIQTLETTLRRHFDVHKLQSLAIYHRYLMALCTK